MLFFEKGPGAAVLFICVFHDQGFSQKCVLVNPVRCCMAQHGHYRDNDLSVCRKLIAKAFLVWWSHTVDLVLLSKRFLCCRLFLCCMRCIFSLGVVELFMFRCPTSVIVVSNFISSPLNMERL